VSIPAPNGALAGWWFPAREQSRGATVVVGGVEGWAMDFDALGVAFAARGVSTLMLDAPGQGESRMANRSFLSANWLASYRAAVDFVSIRCPGAGIGVVGNSMGGAFAMGLACADRRIAACCDNGGPRRSMLGPREMTFSLKQAAMCGQVSWEAASQIWASIDPAPRGAEVECPLLIVHGGMDPLIPVDHPTTLLETARSRDKTMVTFSDGDHCVYNHADDKHNLIADWMSDRLAARQSGLILESPGAHHCCT
jgi:alpha-beta hydrolase superfamily lysophospholipase